MKTDKQIEEFVDILCQLIDVRIENDKIEYGDVILSNSLPLREKLKEKLIVLLNK